MRLQALALLFITGLGTHWWTIQTHGIDTNLRSVSGGYSLDSAGIPSPTVWASGSRGVVLQSNDGGKTWKRIHVQDGDALDFRGIRAFDGKTAYLMSSGKSDKSRIYKTTDGGESWKLQYTDKRHDFFLDALVCLTEKECVALSDPMDGKFLLLHTADGEHWKEIPREAMPLALPGESAFAASGTSLVLLGDEIFFGTGGARASRVFHSPDMGRTWTVAETPIVGGNASSGIFSLVFVGNTLMAVGGDYKDANRSYRAAAYSLDKGISWQLSAHQPGGYRSAVASIDGVFLVAVGPNGEDQSDDLGVHWTQSDALNLNAIFVLDDREIWGVGPNGTVAHYDIPYEIRHLHPGKKTPRLRSALRI